MSRWFTLALFLSLLLFFNSHSTRAAITEGLVLTPAKTELTLAPGASGERLLTLQNYSDQDLFVTISTEDFLTDNAYSLRHYLTYPREPLLLTARGSLQIPISINLPADLPPGGYYAAVFAAATLAADDLPSAVAKTRVVTRLGMLFFVTVPGAVTREGDLKDFGLIGSHFRTHATDLRFHLLYENRGNIYLNPYGKLELTYPSGEIFSQVLDPWFVLPQSERLREIILLTAAPPLTPGRYQAKLILNRGYDNLLTEAQIDFWFLPLWLSGLLILIAVILIVAICRLMLKWRHA